MGIVFWIITIGVVCVITSVIFNKPYLGIVFAIISIPFEDSIILDSVSIYPFFRACVTGSTSCCSIIPVIPDSVSIYPLEVILAICVLVCIYKLIVGRENCFRNTKLMYCCIPFVLCIMLSAMKSIELSLTAKEIVRWLDLFLIYYLTVNLVNDEKKMRVVLYSMFLTVAVVSTCGIINYYNNVGYASWEHRAASSFFGNPNPFVGYVNLIIPVLFGMMMVSVFLWERIVLGVFTILSMIAWLLSFSRAGWLSLILTMIIIFFLTKIKKKVSLFLVTLFVIFAIALLFSDIRGNSIDRVRLQKLLGTLELRAEGYSIGSDMVRDDLILGIGLGNYPLFITKFMKHDYYIHNHLHSLYLQIFVEAGIMGLCAFVFWFACIIKYLIRNLNTLKESRNYSLFVGLMGGIIVFLFNNLTDVLVVHGIHLQWGIMLGLAVVLTQFREPETCPTSV